MGFHLDLYTNILIQPGIFAGSGLRKEAPVRTTFDNCRVIVVSGQYARRTPGMRISDHGKQGEILGLTIQRPAGIEYLVTTVLGIGLGEHHQFCIGRIPSKLFIGSNQVFNLKSGQCQAQLTIGLRKDPLRIHRNICNTQVPGFVMFEKCLG